VPKWEICSHEYMKKTKMEIFTKSLFIEVKQTNNKEFASRSSSTYICTDKRDSIDNNIINSLLSNEQINMDDIEKLNFNPTIDDNYNNQIFEKYTCNYNELTEMQNYWKNNYSKDTKITFENTNNIIVQGLWVGEYLTDIHFACVSSFIKNGHCFILYAYDKIKNLPDGVVLFDANIIINKNLIYKFDDSYAGFSNLFRNKLLYLHGCWYVDLDIYNLKIFDFKDDLILSSDYYPKAEIKLAKKENRVINDKLYIPTNPIKIPKKSPFIFELYEYIYKKIILKIIKDSCISNFKDFLIKIENYDEFKKIFKLNDTFFDANNNLSFNELLAKCDFPPNDVGQKFWGEIGPLILTKKIIEKNLTEHVTKPEVLQGKIKYFEVEKYVDENFDYFSVINDENIYSTDLFFTSWRKKNLLKYVKIKKKNFINYIIQNSL
jgi:hypothetical protein